MYPKKLVFLVFLLPHLTINQRFSRKLGRNPPRFLQACLILQSTSSVTLESPHPLSPKGGRAGGAARGTRSSGGRALWVCGTEPAEGKVSFPCCSLHWTPELALRQQLQRLCSSRPGCATAGPQTSWGSVNTALLAAYGTGSLQNVCSLSHLHPTCTA